MNVRTFGLSLAFAASLLVGCSGGGGSNADAPPQFTTQPAAASVDEGHALTLNVSASGSGTLAYQWQRNGVDITGATTASYTLPAVVTGDSGAAFSVVVRNGAGATTSNSVTLVVNGAVSAQTVGASGGSLALTSNAVQFSINVPAGALAADTAFTLKSQAPEVGELARVEVSPPGVAFSMPVTVTMTLPTGRIITARHVAALRLGSTKTYVPSTVDLGARTVTARLNYLGLNGSAAPSFSNVAIKPARSALAVHPQATVPAANTLTLEELAVLQPQWNIVRQALVDLQAEERFADAAALQLGIAALAQSAQVPEWRADAQEYLRQASTTVCSALDLAVSRARATPVANVGDYRRVAQGIVYWESASRALDAQGCGGNAWSDVLHAKMTQAVSFVSGQVHLPPPPASYGPPAAEIRDAKALAEEARLLVLPSVADDTRQLYVDPALQPLRNAAYQTSLTSNDQSEYFTLLAAFGPTQSLSDDAQYAATVFTVSTVQADGTPRGSQAFGRGATTGTPVRTGTVAASTDGTVRIAGDIAVLHCPDAVVERLQVLFEGVEVASLGSTSEVLLGAGHTLPVLQSAALLRAAGITPERATQHLLQIKRMGSACITGFPIFDDVLAAVALDFTPSTRRLLLVGMEPGSSGIYTINTDGTGRRQLTNSPPYQDNYPTWSPDGRRIAFTRVTRNPAVADPGSPAANIAVLYVMNADGSGLLPLATKHEAEQFAPWSPDGTKLLSYFDPARARDSDPYTYDLHVVNADGSGQVKVHDGTAEVWAAWSPDGRRIAYLDFNDPVLRDPGRLDTYVMNADGSGKTRLTTDGNSQYPTWSPDGTRIAISGRGPNAGFATYVMNADGSGKILVAQDAGLYGNTANPWSPDGRQLVVILVGSGGPAHGILAVYRADGSGQVTASQTSAAFTDGNFSWSPDGRQIAFWRECIDGSTGDSLWVMNADGSSLQPVLSVPRGVNDSWDYAPLWAPR